MKAEIITIGDEILIGQTIDTNSAWIGSQLNEIGFAVNRIVTISDNREEILYALNEASSRASVILITGGLGPTKDDITKKVLCEYFDSELEMHEDILEKLQEGFKQRGIPFLEVNNWQAMLPKKAEILPNVRGTASGMWFEKDGIVYISMPGVPHEMKGILLDHGFNRLKEYFDAPVLYKRTIMTQGIGESLIADTMHEWADKIDKSGLKLAYLPAPGMVRVRLSGVQNEETNLKDQIDNLVNEFVNEMGSFVYGFDDQSLPEAVGELMIKNDLTLSIAESCTGGNVSSEIVSVSGSSKYYMGSIISYDNDIKVRELGVNPKVIQEVGAVSEEVVTQMADGIRKKMNTDYGVATSGIAGPTGGSDRKPVGTVWIAIASKNGVNAKKYSFGKSRERNINVSTSTALQMLRHKIIDEHS